MPFVLWCDASDWVSMVAHPLQFGSQQRNGGGAVPIELGVATGSSGERPETQKSFLCGKIGHLKKDCPTKK